MNANLHKKIIPGRFNAVALALGQIALVGVLAAAPASGVLELRAIRDFTVSRKPPYVPAYKDGNNQALAIDAAQHKNQFAAGEAVFPGPSGTYDVVITTLTETDGESTYQLFVQGKKLGEFQNPKTDEDYIPAQHRWKNVALQQGDEVLVAFNTHSNGRTPEGSGFAFARGRWRSLAFVAPGGAYVVSEDTEGPLPDKDASAYFQFDFNPATADKIFEERDGLVVVEAEHFAGQVNDSVRRWYLTTTNHTPTGLRDPDGNHAASAGGGAYLEILPDTRKDHGEPLVEHENFSEDPGRLAVLYYAVYFHTPGRYYVWARACPTGSEDNGLHVGLDGKWPGSGRRMQWIGKNSAWLWDSKQRTDKVHTGVKYRVYLDIEKPGYHTVMFSMREDGFEMDRWLMSTNRDVLVHGDTALGPPASPLWKGERQPSGATR